jgi:hypothetical protein
VYTCRAAFLTLSFLTLVCVADDANAAPSPRCAAITSADSLNDPLDSLRSLGATQLALKSDIAGADLPPSLKLRGASNVGPYMELPKLHWERVPELVVLTSVMQYEKGRSTEYLATAQQLTAAEVDSLVADLTRALSVLTDDVFKGFAAVHRETAAAGATVNIMRPGQIVVARYQGVRDQLATIGFGGRSTRNDIIRAGSIILDSDFDRTRTERRLLRTHELGHALGYNHVESRVSIMNPKVGSELTDVDRAIARVAFRKPAAEEASCAIPVG